MTIGERIKEIRTKMGLNQKEFASLLGMSISYISKVESDNKKPGRELLEKIASECHVSIDYLLGTSDDSRSLKRRILDEAYNMSEDDNKYVEQLLLLDEEEIKEILDSTAQLYIDRTMSYEDFLNIIKANPNKKDILVQITEKEFNENFKPKFINQMKLQEKINISRMFGITVEKKDGGKLSLPSVDNQLIDAETYECFKGLSSDDKKYVKENLKSVINHLSQKS